MMASFISCVQQLLLAILIPRVRSQLSSKNASRDQLMGALVESFIDLHTGIESPVGGDAAEPIA